MTYDFYAIVDSAVGDGAEAKLKTLVEKDGFEVSHFENWGKKAFSYPIKKKTEGIYCSMVLTGKVNPAKLNERFKLDESILRTLVLKPNKKAAARVPVSEVKAA